MELAKPDLKGKAVFGDHHSMIWVSDEGELNRYVAQCVEADHAWARRDDILTFRSGCGTCDVGSSPVAPPRKACEYRPIEMPDSFPFGQRQVL